MGELILNTTIPLSGRVDQAAARLAELPGVLGVSPAARCLKVRYDARRIPARALETFLESAGYPVSCGTLDRLRREWVDFRENNLLAHAQSVPRRHGWPPG